MSKTYNISKLQSTLPTNYEDNMEPAAYIRHIAVTPQGIETSQLDQLVSDKGIRAIFKTAIFSASQRLLNQASQLKKMDTFADRLKDQGLPAKAEAFLESDRYIKINNGAVEAAQRLACLHAISDSKGFNIDVELNPMLNRGSNKEQIEMKAKFAKMTVAEVQAIEDKNALKQLQDANAGVTLAEELFYGAETECEYEITLEDDEVTHQAATIKQYIHPEAALKDLQRTRDWLVGWNNPDYTEIGLLACDIESMENAVARFTEMVEYGTEESRDFDDKAANSQDMTQGVRQEAA